MEGRTNNLPLAPRYSQLQISSYVQLSNSAPVLKEEFLAGGLATEIATENTETTEAFLRDAQCSVGCEERSVTLLI